PPPSSSLFPYTTLFRSALARKFASFPKLLTHEKEGSLVFNRSIHRSRRRFHRSLRALPGGAEARPQFDIGPTSVGTSSGPVLPRSESTRLNSSHLVISY